MAKIRAGDGAAPVVVTARLEEPLSRWIWLVKWLLLLPHYVILAFLWAAFTVVTVVAFFAILVTGRYPRSLFHVNLGVLRWSWRVGYYGYSALGTDRYPPFTLAEVPEYPATVDIAYPQRLSRGLVLVKSWLLALPHLLFLSFVVGGASWTVEAAREDPGGWTVGSGGLLGLLVLIAGVVLLVTARYPRGLYDLVVGLDRWVLRVVAYVALMTDGYPPFRLDQGGTDPSEPTPSGPGTAPARTVAPGTGRPASSAGAPAPRSSAGAAVMLGLGLVALLPGLVMTGLGGTGLVLDAQRDATGFVSTDTRSISSSTAAVTVESIDIHFDRGTSTWGSADRFGTVRARATTQGEPVFVGIAPQREIDAWLVGVAHDRVRDIGAGTIVYDRQNGRDDAGAPSEQSFWAASTEGAGTQELTWPVETGRWALVVAQADGSPGFEATVDVGARIPSLNRVGAALLAAGLTTLVVATVLMVLGAAGLGRSTSGPAGGRGPSHQPTFRPPGPRPAPAAESTEHPASDSRTPVSGRP